VAPVTIMGRRATDAGWRAWRVPKRELIAGLMVSLQTGSCGLRGSCAKRGRMTTWFWAGGVAGAEQEK
jgi:hypothetical protein